MSSRVSGLKTYTHIDASNLLLGQNGFDILLPGKEYIADKEGAIVYEDDGSDVERILGVKEWIAIKCVGNASGDIDDDLEKGGVSLQVKRTGKGSTLTSAKTVSDTSGISSGGALVFIQPSHAGLTMDDIVSIEAISKDSGVNWITTGWSVSGNTVTVDAGVLADDDEVVAQYSFVDPSSADLTATLDGNNKPTGLYNPNSAASYLFLQIGRMWTGRFSHIAVHAAVPGWTGRILAYRGHSSEAKNKWTTT